MDESGVSIHGREGKYRPVPVEYKRGRPKENDADVLQLCAQAMCLEEMLVCRISVGYLFYGETRRRLEVVFTDELQQRVTDTFQEMHSYYRRGYTPKVRPKKSCKACSLADQCMPGLGKNKSAITYMQAKLGEEAEAEE